MAQLKRDHPELALTAIDEDPGRRQGGWVGHPGIPGKDQLTIMVSITASSIIKHGEPLKLS